MVMPQWLARLNRTVTNRVLRWLVGIGPLAELEHTGRRSGRSFRTVIMAFRQQDTITIALTYGPDVDWLKNLRAAGGGRLRLGRELLELGAPRPLTTAEGMSRMPFGPRHILPIAGCDEFVELAVLRARRRRR
jgi:deazaflavin-dependent oxidoreductase (nitroreductase family)